MRRAFTALLAAALLTTALVAPASAGDNKGKRFAVGAFHSAGSGSYVHGVGTASGASAHEYIPATQHQDSVRLFAYGGGPSEGRVYCGEVWNVIISAAFGFREDKPFLKGIYYDQYLDGDKVGATDESPIKANQGFLGGKGFVRIYGTFLPPGTLTNATHSVKQVMWHPDVPFPLWDPPPLIFDVSDSAC